MLEIVKNYSHSPIIYSKSFPVMLSKTIRWNDLVELYKALLSLGMIIVVDILKWDGQWSKSIQVLVMLVSLLMYSLFLTIFLRCLQNNLFNSRVKELLYLLMVSMIFTFEKGGHFVTFLSEILSKRLGSIY